MASVSTFSKKKEFGFELYLSKNLYLCTLEIVFSSIGLQ